MRELGKYTLPKGWEWATIPELTGKQGVFIDGDWVESKDQDLNGDVRLIQLADIGDGNYRDKSARFLTSKKAVELGCTFLNEGDVLIARMPDPLGRACIFPGDKKRAVTVVDVCIVRSSNGEFNHRWLSCFVNAHPFRSAIDSLQAGSTRKRISRRNLATIPLPVPPHAEQRRIVEEIEKQFTRLEAGVAALKRVQANLKRYRAAVLKAACGGELVPKRSNWVETTLGAVTEEKVLQAGPKGKSKFIYVDISSIDNMTKRVVRPKTLSVVNAPSRAKQNLTIGDVLVSMTRPNLNAIAFVTFELDGSIGSTGFHVLRARDVNPKWLFYIVQTNNFVDVMCKLVQGALYPAVRPKDIRAYSFFLPSKAEQKQIVAEVERRLSVVEELEAVVKLNLDRATRLRQAILQKAFSGNLV